MQAKKPNAWESEVHTTEQVTDQGKSQGAPTLHLPTLHYLYTQRPNRCSIFAQLFVQAPLSSCISGLQTCLPPDQMLHQHHQHAVLDKFASLLYPTTHQIPASQGLAQSFEGPAKDLAGAHVFSGIMV